MHAQKSSCLPCHDDAITDRLNLGQFKTLTLYPHGTISREINRERRARACTLRRLYSMGQGTLDGAKSLAADPNSPPRRAAPTTAAAVAPGAAHRAYDRAP